MFTWCSRAVNCSLPSFFAALRTRSSPIGPLLWLGVQHGLDCSAFSLVNGLPSTTSAGGFPLLFGCFAGITPLYDSPPPCMWVLSLIAFSHRPAISRLRAATGSPGSRAWSFYTCLGSTTPPGCDALAWRTPHRGLPELLTPSAPGLRISELNTLPAYAPVNASSAALRPPSHDSDSRWIATPFLTTLSFVTPCRFYPGANQKYPRAHMCCPQ